MSGRTNLPVAILSLQGVGMAGIGHAFVSVYHTNLGFGELLFRVKGGCLSIFGFA